jgi:hypothetical protein
MTVLCKLSVTNRFHTTFTPTSDHRRRVITFTVCESMSGLWLQTIQRSSVLQKIGAARMHVHLPPPLPRKYVRVQTDVHPVRLR